MGQQEKIQLPYGEAGPCFLAWTGLKYREVVARLPVPPFPYGMAKSDSYSSDVNHLGLRAGERNRV